MSTDKTERLGQLLIRYQLLELGIPTQVVGEDLLTSDREQRRRTIQVYVADGAADVGGVCAWRIARDPERDVIALIDIETERCWALEADDITRFSKVQTDGSRLIYTYAMPTFDPEKTGHAVFSADFDKMLLATRAKGLFTHGR